MDDELPLSDELSLSNETNRLDHANLFEQMIEFHPSEAAQSRVEELIAKEQEGTLAEQERLELEDYMQFDHIMTLMKARAAQVLASLAP